MSDSKAVKTTERGEVKSAASRPDVYLTPAVDIYEDASGITLQADLPGVSRERLDVQVEGNNLTIEGEVALAMSEGMEALYADINATRYRRSFTLGNELETDNISAEIRNGTLTLHLPKKAELQPRKIEIKAA
jgi:HSP20 family molecular chaperone IbpA